MGVRVLVELPLLVEVPDDDCDLNELREELPVAVDVFVGGSEKDEVLDEDDVLERCAVDVPNAEDELVLDDEEDEVGDLELVIVLDDVDDDVCVLL